MTKRDRVKAEHRIEERAEEEAVATTTPPPPCTTQEANQCCSTPTRNYSLDQNFINALEANKGHGIANRLTAGQVMDFLREHAYEPGYDLFIKRYVAAFVPILSTKSELGRSPSKLLLIRKNRPNWQAGLLNGVGGKVKVCDWEMSDYLAHRISPWQAAMMREWQEETGLNPLPNMMADDFHKWEERVLLYGFNRDGEFFIVHFFTHTKPEELDLSGLDEQENDCGEVFEMKDLNSLARSNYAECIPNLRWLVPLCLYSKNVDYPIFVNDTESNN